MAISTPIRLGICDVHRLLDFDCEARVCFYCGMCDAWICQEDENRWDRRLRAALKRKLESGYRGIPDYNQQMENQLKGNGNGTNSNTNA